MRWKIVKNEFVLEAQEFHKNESYDLLSTQFVLKNPSFGERAVKDIYDKNIDNVRKCINLDNRVNKIMLFGEVQSGKTNNMLFLTAALKDLGFNKFIIFTGTKNNLNIQNIKRFKEFFKDDEFLEFNKFHFNPKSNQFFYGLKQNIPKLLDSLVDLDITELNKIKIAIIDDESDEASSEKSKENRKINDLIKNILDIKFKNVIYLPITATPYANLTSTTDEISPEFVIPLQSSEKYCGLRKFRENNCYKTIKENFSEEFKSVEPVSQQIKDEMMNILIVYLKDIINSNQCYDLLINISSDNTHIKKIAVVVNKLFDQLKLKNQEFWNSKKIEIDFFKLQNILNAIEIKTLFQKGNYKSNNDFNQIVIGGNLLSRGVTFEKLHSEIMLNIPSGEISPDTLLQRARWFGYREDRIKTMKIYTTEKGITFYNKIEDIEKKIRNLYLENNIHNKIVVEKIKEIFSEYSLKVAK